MAGMDDEGAREERVARVGAGTTALEGCGAVRMLEWGWDSGSGRGTVRR
jgi:hypothetical protein